MKTLRKIWGVGVAATALSLAAHAQGILTVTPGRTAATTAGTGVVGYTGDNGAATAATLANPSAVAYDASGNLFIADTANHVIREVVKSSGNIVTVAGTGTAGFSGDGGAATGAQLDTPTGIAVDANGNLFIADSHNHRIREVSGGNITTIAGTGIAGFAGDGAAATSAQLASPQGVAVDSNGNIYIADTNNQRIRKISGGTITTIAGTGEQSFTGDGGAATVATLDSPTSVAVDAAGDVFIADRHNQRVREIAASGTITTVAGTGTPSFAGSFGGDGGSATAASLSRPTGVSVDAAGNVYIADSNNQRVRTVTAGSISTAAGTGEQGFAGDSGPLSGAVLNTPKSVAVDATGDVAIADKGNERVRAAADATVAFGSSAVGVASSTQTITLSNTGAASLTVTSAAVTGPFALTTVGSCSAAPITLAVGASCTEMLDLVPTAPGAASGAIAFSGAGVAPQTVLLTGTGTKASTTVAVTSSVVAPFINQPITFTATITPAGLGSATGTVTFYANGTAIAAAQPVSGNKATLTTSFTSGGTYAITATYSGDGNFLTATSPAVTQLVGDFSFTITPQPGQLGAATVIPGHAATFNLVAAPLNGPFSFPITLSATGLPPGATATFSPSTVTLGSTAAPFTLTVQVPANTAAMRRVGGFGTTVMALVLLPFARRMRRRGRKLRVLAMAGFAVLSLGSLGAMTGCGTDSGFFGSAPKTYNINVVGTATNAQGATVQHVATLQLTVE